MKTARLPRGPRARAHNMPVARPGNGHIPSTARFVGAPAGALGFLLPLYSVASFDPAIFAWGRGTLIAVLFFIMIVAPGHLRAKKPALPWSFLLVGLFIAAASSLDEFSVSRLLLAVALILIASFLASDKRWLAWLARGFTAGVLVSSIALFLQVFGIDAFSPDVVQRPGYWGLSYRSTAFAYDAAAGVCLLLWPRIVSQDRLYLRWASSSAAGIVGTACVISVGRGGVIALAAGLIVGVIGAGCSGPELFRRHMFRITCSAVGALLILQFMPATLNFTAIDRLAEAGVNVDAHAFDEYGSGRADFARKALAASLSGWNIFFGSPEYGKSLEGSISGGATNPHNAFLIGLSNAGIVGFLSVVLIYASLVITAVRQRYAIASNGDVWLVAAAFTYLVRGLFSSSGLITVAAPMVVFVALHTALLRLYRSPSNPKIPRA